MSKKTLAIPLVLVMLFVTWESALGTGPTTDPWPSFRHDLLNSGAATGSGYPDTLNKLWMVNREYRTAGTNLLAGSRGPLVVDRGMIITAGTGVIQANDQFSGSLLWHEHFLWASPEEPAGAPTDWCYNDIPQIEGNTGVCYATGDCPSWCFECTAVEPTCPSLIKPLDFPAGYDQFLTGPTVDPSYGLDGAVIFGTFDGRVISLNMNDGSTIWEKTPYKDPGGPNVGKPWYHQKYAWHLSPPSIADGKVYIGSFSAQFLCRLQALGLCDTRTTRVSLALYRKRCHQLLGRT